MASMASIPTFNWRESIITSDSLVPGGRTKIPYYISSYTHKDVDRLSQKVDKLRRLLESIYEHKHLKDYIIHLTIARTAYR